MEYFELNKLSHLHDGENIIFCKTDFLEAEFNSIRKLKNNVILISGNSDYPIDDKYFYNTPKNILKWYAVNALSHHEILIPIPLGLENGLFSIRKEHGIAYPDRSREKEKLLKRELEVKAGKWIYSNFITETNYIHRNEIKKLSVNNKHIDWEEPNLKLVDFFDRILEYKMVICPSGNGIDTHRLWEVLYSNRIPITIKIGDYKIYELYKELPIIVLDNVNDLKDNNLITKEYNRIKSIDWNLDKLNFNYWENLITKNGNIN